MTAIRLARGYTGRTKIVKFAGCYHGHVDSLLVKAGSGALTLGNPDSAGIPLSFAAETLVLPFNDFTAIETIFSQKGTEIAAVIVEPYPANCGLILPRPNYLQTLRQLCTKHGSVLIFDEVMTGFRVALGGVQEIENVIPDLTTLGKIIGGGLPVGALGGKREIMDKLAPLGTVYQAGTLSGNPLAMTAGITAIEMLLEETIYNRLNAHTQQIANALLNAAKSKGIGLQVPFAPSMFCIYFSDSPVYDYTEATTTRSEYFKKLFHFALINGVYLPPSPYETCFLSTAHSDLQIEQTIEILVEGLQSL